MKKKCAVPVEYHQAEQPVWWGVVGGEIRTEKRENGRRKDLNKLWSTSPPKSGEKHEYRQLQSLVWWFEA